MLFVLVQVVVLWGSNGLNWGQVAIPHAEASRVVKVFESEAQCVQAKGLLDADNPKGHAFACVPIAGLKK
ncbi:MAG: hypothetical protein HRU82_02610 [Nitrospira sp.]|nr:MAG: hypothetical protein HRU82_02610 [Nitrospira sp.]